VRRDKEQTQLILDKYQIDAIISDQRFGVHSPDVPSVLISHQLNPPVPGLRGMVRNINFGFYRQFNEVWVPDVEGAGSLSGELGFSGGCPVPVRYVGYLSRFSPCNESMDVKKLVVSISGPEPQRAAFEQQVFDFLATTSFHLNHQVTIIRGLPHDSKRIDFHGVCVENHLTCEAFSAQLCTARWIVSRSGYTSLMDYATMGKKAIIIPTPGQAEQEYLARLLKSHPLFVSATQKDMNLTELMNELDQKQHVNFNVVASSGALDKALQAFLSLTS
jgi:predicted glycosyltransferase